MSATTFDPNDHRTWPTLLTAKEVAAIFRRSVKTIQRRVREGQFKPAPTVDGLWRRGEVIRTVKPEAVQ